MVPTLGCTCARRPLTPTAPVVASITPSEGLAGVPMRSRSAPFLVGASVSIDGDAAENRSSTGRPPSIGATTPRIHWQGSDVVVTNPNGQIALTAGFRYIPVTLTATPSSVAPGGTLSVSWVRRAVAPDLNGDWIGLFRVGDSNTARCGACPQRA